MGRVIETMLHQLRPILFALKSTIGYGGHVMRVFVWIAFMIFTVQGQAVLQTGPSCWQ